MPPAYIQALLESENPFGAKPVHDFKIIREIVEEAHGRPLHDVFSEFSFVPVATGSIAQVHFAVLRESGAEVAVKVTKGRLNQAALLGDVETMLVTARLLKLSGMDGGIDLPTIIKSYLEIVPEEFDLRLESEKMQRFTELFADWGLDDRVLIPTVVPELTSRDVLVIERIRGVGMIDVLQAAGETGDRPVLPTAAAGLLGDWDGFFQTVFEAWGRMIFLNGTVRQLRPPRREERRRTDKETSFTRTRTRATSGSRRTAGFTSSTLARRRPCGPRRRCASRASWGLWRPRT